MYGLLLFLHILGATIWTGGHIVLSVIVLPKALKERSTEQLLNFESVYEKLGMPALIVQVITGFMLAYRMLPDITQWFNLSHPISYVLTAKFVLLALTIGFAVDARFRVMPVLSENNLNVMAWHIIPVTIFSILYLIAGVSFRTGWMY